MRRVKVFGIGILIVVLLLLVGILGTIMAQNMAAPITYADTWTWPYQPDELAHLSAGRFIVTVQDDNKIALIDPDAEDYGLTFVETEYVQPHHPWMAPGMRYVYINFQSEGKGDHDAFGRLDTFTLEMEYTTTGINDPFHGAFSPTDPILVTADIATDGGHVYIWNTDTFELMGTVETSGLRTRDINITHDGKYAFVGQQGYDPDNGVVGGVDVLDIEAQEIVATLGEGRCRAGKMNNAGTLVLYSCDRADRIVVIDVETLELVKYIETGEGSGPFNISFRSDDAFAYVGLKSMGHLGVIDMESLELVASLESGTDTNSTYFHPTAPLAIVTNDGTDAHVSVLNTETNTIDYHVETGKGTHNGQWSPDGRWFIVSNRLDDSVTLMTYNEETGMVEWWDDITIGFGANGVHWGPYFCGVDALTTENVADVRNEPAADADGTCPE